ncbi:MAG: DUF2934 domain-containing protein [Proteobacteria bacterium]|nr:MAG: DUF2934 domain-containing protein [Pseudomonadota bacterium]
MTKELADRLHAKIKERALSVYIASGRIPNRDNENWETARRQVDQQIQKEAYFLWTRTHSGTPEYNYEQAIAMVCPALPSSPPAPFVSRPPVLPPAPVPIVPKVVPATPAPTQELPPEIEGKLSRLLSIWVKPKYHEIVLTAATGMMAFAYFNLFPLVDAIAVGTIWTAMFAAIFKESGHSLNGTALAKLTATAITGWSAYALGSKLFTLAAVPLLGAAVPMIATATVLNIALNVIFTVRLAKYMIDQLERPNIDVGKDIFECCLSIIPAVFKMPSMEEIRSVADCLRS